LIFIKARQTISVKQRGWTLDVLNIVRRIVSEGRVARVPNQTGKSGTQLGTRGTRPSDSSDEFTNADVYACTRELERLHPDNAAGIMPAGVLRPDKPAAGDYFASLVAPAFIRWKTAS